MTEIHWAQQAPFPLLAALQLVPLLGVALLALLRRRNWAPYLGQVVAAAELGLALGLRAALDTHSTVMQLAERVHFAAPLDYHAGADGLTVLFVLLSALLTLLVSAWPSRFGCRRRFW